MLEIPAQGRNDRGFYTGVAAVFVSACSSIPAQKEALLCGRKYVKLTLIYTAPILARKKVNAMDEETLRPILPKLPATSADASLEHTAESSAPELEPVPLPPVDAVCTVTVSRDKRTAALVLTAPKNGGAEATMLTILRALTAAGVIHGLKQDTLRRLATTPVYRRAEMVAAASAPIVGKDGHLEFCVKPSSGFAPQERKDGTVDYRIMRTIPTVREGDTIVIRHPPTPGTPGTNVLGEPIPAKAGREIPLPLGKNVQVSEDGHRLLSMINGQVVFTSRRVNVFNTYTVLGDVGVATGNIDVLGNVLVKGNIQPGYAVKCEGDITIEGIVEDATLIAAGDISIRGGYLGSSKSEIRCGGSLQVKFIQNGRVTVEGDLYAEFLIGSEVRSGGTARLVGGKGTILGGRLVTRHAIDCAEAGARLSEWETILETGNDPETVARNQAIPYELEEVARNMNSLSRLVAVYNQRRERGLLAPEKQEELVRLLQTMSYLNNQQQALEQERLRVTQTMLSTGYGVINIRGIVYPGVQIIIGPEQQRVQTEVNNVLFSRGPAGLVCAPAHMRKNSLS